MTFTSRHRDPISLNPSCFGTHAVSGCLAITEYWICRRYTPGMLFTWCLLVLLAGCGTSDTATAGRPPKGDASEQDVAPENDSGAASMAGDISSAHSTAIETRDQTLDEVDRHRASGNLDQATVMLRELLLSDPQDYEVIFQLATIKAEEGKLSDAVELMGDIPPEAPEAGLPALGFSADWCLDLERYDDAEQRYRKILELSPMANVAKRKLAHLLNREGRRHEAVQLIRELCLAGDVTQDELHALIVEGDAMYDEPGTNPDSDYIPYFPIGEMGHARQLFTERRYLDAALAVEPLLKSGSALPSVVAFYGAAVSEAQDDERFAWWLTQVSEPVKQFPEYWSAIATQLSVQAKNEEAIRACSEALSRDPTDMRSIRRIGQAFINLENGEMEDRWAKRFEALTRIVDASLRVADSRPPSVSAIADLSKDLESIGRSLESVMWKTVGAIHHQAGPDVVGTLTQQMRILIRTNKAFPNMETALCGVQIKDFPEAVIPAASLPTLFSQSTTLPKSLDSPPPATFTDISKRIGLAHRFKVSVEPRDKAFAIYQSFGGGLGILDYDLDGRPDIYLAQGAADPPGFLAVESDILYRSVPTTSGEVRLVDETNPSGVRDDQYSIGVTAGDWNQDGFIDIAVSNIGTHSLLINNGDGTFHKQPVEEMPSFTRGCSSIALADVSGDHLPDLYVVNYLDDTNLTTLPTINAVGHVENAISPFSVKASLDDLWTNDGQGGRVHTKMGNEDKDPKHGLGIVISDFIDTPGNEIFIGNDEQPNQLWIRDASNGSWTDQAGPRGCAFGGLGNATGSMGIAVADFDRSGSQDIQISNFYNEPFSFYLNHDGMFRDKNVKYRLDQVSMPAVGFGSQAIDYSLDGWVDLVVTNGHVENMESKDQPFRQATQLFSNLADRFELVRVEDATGYWSQPHVGRGLTTLDFNRDGKVDFITTDIVDPTALLLNESPTENHWIGLRLIGTSSERDAIGAKIEVQVEGEQWTGWVNAGDGYLGKNEPTVVFGIGNQKRVKQLLVTWPSGSKQTFANLDVDQYVQITENESDPFEFR